MEQELGFQLFQRVGKSIYLTQAGEYLYEQFKELPDYCAQAIAQATALSRGDVGSLSVGILEGQDINRALNDRAGRHPQPLSRAGAPAGAQLLPQPAPGPGELPV